MAIGDRELEPDDVPMDLEEMLEEVVNELEGDPDGGMVDLRHAQMVVAPLDGDVVEEWNDHVRALCRLEHWGPCSFMYKPIRAGSPFGAIEATCVWHKLSTSSGCKKAMNIRARTPEAIASSLWTLKH